MSRQTDRNDADHFVERILLREEISAERVIAWMRLAAVIAIGATFFLAVEFLDFFNIVEIRSDVIPSAGNAAGFHWRGIVSIGVLLLTGLLALWLTRPARWRPIYAYGFVVMDAAILLFAIYRPLWRFDLPGNFAVLAPALFAVPIAFALNALRPRPEVHYVFIGMFTAGLLAMIYSLGLLFEPVEPEMLKRSSIFFDLRNNIVRLLLLLAAGLTIAVGVVRSRALLRRSVEESQQRKTLMRFLPAEFTQRVAGSRIEALRQGERRIITIMFVDIRDSTARGETMDPMRLSIFISAFRRRVSRACRAHNGVVDKFIGDGALVLFGLEEGDGAIHALAAAEDILRLIDRWNAKRNFNPPVRIGIGIHTGEAYVGVVGSEDRLEFTVLGDAVNIAARLEQLTKTAGVPVLASATTVAMAHAPAGWATIGDEPLRGRSGELAYCGRVHDQSAGQRLRVA